MEFKSLKNIETSFKQIRLFGIVFVVMCTLITGYAVLELLHVCRSATAENLCIGRW